MGAFDKIVEQRIKAAEKQGLFDNLPGKGKPLVFDDDNVPEDLRMAYKILKNAGCTPPELELRKQISRTEDLLSQMDDTRERYKAIKKLNSLVLRYNMIHNGSMALDVQSEYQTKIVNRLKKTADAKK